MNTPFTLLARSPGIPWSLVASAIQRQTLVVKRRRLRKTTDNFHKIIETDGTKEAIDLAIKRENDGIAQWL